MARPLACGMLALFGLLQGATAASALDIRRPVQRDVGAAPLDPSWLPASLPGTNPAARGLRLYADAVTRLSSELRLNHFGVTVPEQVALEASVSRVGTSRVEAGWQRYQSAMPTMLEVLPLAAGLVAIVAQIAPRLGPRAQNGAAETRGRALELLLTPGGALLRAQL